MPQSLVGEAAPSCPLYGRPPTAQKFKRLTRVAAIFPNEASLLRVAKALLRRIQRHIHFRLPNASMRRELFAHHLPNPERVQADYAVLAELSPPFPFGRSFFIASQRREGREQAEAQRPLRSAIGCHGSAKCVRRPM